MLRHRLLNILQRRQQNQSDALTLRRKREAGNTPNLQPAPLVK